MMNCYPEIRAVCNGDGGTGIELSEALYTETVTEASGEHFLEYHADITNRGSRPVFLSHGGQIIYGIGIGVITVIIRLWGSYPEGMSFAILIMNAVTPLINNYVRPKPFSKL